MPVGQPRFKRTHRSRGLVALHIDGNPEPGNGLRGALLPPIEGQVLGDVYCLLKSDAHGAEYFIKTLFSSDYPEDR
jgi:hypothetical protein